jgi:DNA repair protein RadC
VSEALRGAAPDDGARYGDQKRDRERDREDGDEWEASPAAALAPDGPRERLGRLGVAALSDAELVCLLLRTGGGGRDVLDVARSLLASCGGLAALAREDASLLREVSGIGPAKSAAIVAAAEIGRRLATRRLEAGHRIRAPADVHRHFFERLRDERQERFHALLLDGRHRVIREVLVSQGTLTASLVHPREVFRQAVRQSAAALVLVHNHPSGDPSPSGEDRRVTERLVRAGEVLGIRVLDHVVVAEHGYHSFDEAGEL